MHKVKPCPFCGSKQRTLWKSRHSRLRYHMECDDCNSCAERSFTKWGAIRKWNRMKNWRVVK